MTGFTRISCADAKLLLDTKAVNIVDIRDEASYNAGHIIDAEHIDNQSMPRFIDDTEQDTALIVCCYHGNSSQPAAAYMAEKGFSEVYSLDGGYQEWQSTYPESCEKEG